MFKYRFVCTNKEIIENKIYQTITNDLPCGKSIFGGDLYKSGIHFQECGEVIKGFYIDESEIESARGAPIRVCFTGKFVYENQNLFFDVYIYPRIIESIFIIVAFLAISCVNVINFLAATVGFFFFAKGYYDMMKDTYNILNRIFN